MLDIKKNFHRKKSQCRVAEFLLRNGIRISKKKLFSCGIEVSPTKIARALGIDRRVVNSTVDTISCDPKLSKIFARLNSVLLLRDVAPELGFGAIEIIPSDAASRGIISGITGIIANAEIGIRQLTTDDPMFANAGMTIITEKPIPRELIDDMLQIEGVKKVIVLS